MKIGTLCLLVAISASPVHGRIRGAERRLDQEAPTAGPVEEVVAEEDWVDELTATPNPDYAYGDKHSDTSKSKKSKVSSAGRTLSIFIYMRYEVITCLWWSN
jgi:hypothetical protein